MLPRDAGISTPMERASGLLWGARANFPYGTLRSGCCGSRSLNSRRSLPVAPLLFRLFFFLHPNYRFHPHKFLILKVLILKDLILKEFRTENDPKLEKIRKKRKNLENRNRNQDKYPEQEEKEKKEKVPKNEKNRDLYICVTNH